VTTKELELDQHQKDVGMAVDMELARRAAVFLGNGVCPFPPFKTDVLTDGTKWSSFTSNIVHRRLVDKRDPISIRFF